MRLWPTAEPTIHLIHTTTNGKEPVAHFNGAAHDNRKNGLVIPADRSRILDSLLDDSSPLNEHGLKGLLKTLFPNGHPNLTAVEFIRALCHDDALAEELQSWRNAGRATANRRALAAAKPPV